MEIEKAQKAQTLMEQMRKYEEIKEFAMLGEGVLLLEELRFGSPRRYILEDIRGPRIKNDVFKKAIIKTLDNEINNIKNEIEGL